MPQSHPPAAILEPPIRRLAARLAGAVLVLATTFALAEPADTDATLDTLRKQLDSTQQALKDPDKLRDAELQRLRATVLAVQTQSSDIADQVAPQLTSIEARIAELGTPVPTVKEDPDVAGQRTLLAKSRGQLDAQAKLARLESVESEQLEAQIAALRRLQFQARLGERTDGVLAATFWSDLGDDWPLVRQRLGALAGEVTTAARTTPLGVWASAFVLMAALWTLPHLAARRLGGFLSARVPAGRLRRSLLAMTTVVGWTLLFGVTAALLGAALDWRHTLAPATASFASRLIGMCWFSGFLFGLATALIGARRSSWRLVAIPDAVATGLRRFPWQITLVSFVGWVAEHLGAQVNASLSTTVAVNALVALALSLTVALALMRADRRWRGELVGKSKGATSRPVWLMTVVALNWLVLLLAIASLFAGYVAFGNFAAKQIVWAAIVVGTTYLLATLIDDALMAWLGNAERTDAQGEPADDGRTPPARAYAQAAVLLSALLRLTLTLFALVLLLAPFGEGPADLMRRSSQWRDGVSIGQVTLQPTAVLQAIAVLVLGLGAVRWLRRWLEDRYLPTTSLDAGMRTSATSLFGYAGVVVAVALSMSALGIGLERIAWVASALSVGIGFGLQAVVQNFVSGLILLAERPVKVGDWVSLGGVEGDIRRINVRATEIQMGDRSTVIVPNSEFITKVVRNVTLADPLGLVQVKLPVPLGTDPDQVRELLLQAFDANTDVLDTPAPAVLLDGIDGGQLIFNATGFVKSPRLAGNVRSALLFDVLVRVKAAGIALSAPPTMLISPQPAAPALPGVTAAAEPTVARNP